MKSILLLLAAIVIAVPAFGLTYDQNVTPDVIFGSGNDNGFFTVDTQNSIELGLRAKLRFDANNQPQNIFNSNGDGTYFFDAVSAPIGFSWVPDPSTTPVWNFEFTVNVDVDGGGARNLDDLTYELGLDFDPSPAATNYLVFDPITPNGSVPYYDHAIGDNSGFVGVAGDGPTYVGLLSANNVAQNSWNYEFFNDAPFDNFDPTVDGIYEIYLKAYLDGAVVAHTNITIIVGGAVGTEETTWGGVKSLFR